jgi:hypothetical protein
VHCEHLLLPQHCVEAPQLPQLSQHVALMSQRHCLTQSTHCVPFAGQRWALQLLQSSASVAAGQLLLLYSARPRDHC